MSYKAANTIFDALRAQMENELQNDTDLIVIYDGSLGRAMEEHLGQRLTGFKHGSFVFFGFSDEVPDKVSGTGSPIRTRMTIDIYVVVRASGRTRYSTDRERLNDISDKVVHEVFSVCDSDGWVAEMKSNVAAMQFVTRRRQETGDDLMAHMVRFTCVTRQ